MKLAQLRELYDKSSPPQRESANEDRNMTDHDQDGGREGPKPGEISLEPDPRQNGGHFFDKDGKMTPGQKEKYKHEHEKSEYPSEPLNQSGDGHKKKSAYRDFVSKEMKKGVSMAEAAKKWKSQKGGHYANADGTTTDKRDGNVGGYEHKHPGRNPAKKRSEGTEIEDKKESRTTQKQNSPLAIKDKQPDDDDPIPEDDQQGDGIIEEGMNWVDKEHTKHPFLTDLAEGAAFAGATALTGGLADAALGAAGIGAEEVAGMSAEDVADTVAQRGLSALRRKAASALSSGAEEGAEEEAGEEGGQSVLGQVKDSVKQRLSDQADEVQKTIGQKVREGVQSATTAGRNLGLTEGFSKGIEQNFDQEKAEGEEAKEREAEQNYIAPTYYADTADAYSANYAALAAPAEGASIFG